MDSSDVMGIQEWIDGYYNIADMYTRLDTSCLGDTAELQMLVAEYFPMMMSTVDSLLGPTGSIVVPDDCGTPTKNVAAILNSVADNYLEMPDDEWSKIPDMLVGDPKKFMDFTPFDHIILSLLVDRYYAMNDKYMETTYQRSIDRVQELYESETDERVQLRFIGYRIVGGDTVRSDTIGGIP